MAEAQGLSAGGPSAGGSVPRGLECPRCGCHHFEVVYTQRLSAGGVRRRRECRHCGCRITTIEQVIPPFSRRS